MSTEIQNSIDRLKEELEKRIQLLTNGTTSANLDKDAYEELVSIIKSVTHMSPNKLTSEDITSFRVVEIERILEIICVDEETKNNILNNFNPNVYSVKNSKSQTRVLEITKFFENIRKIIISYLDQYEMINSTQQSVQDTKVAEYKFYIDLLTKDSFDTLFNENDIDQLLKLMSNIAIPISDRQHILQYIAMQNLNVPSDNPNLGKEQLNLISRVNTICELYINGHEDLKEKVQNELDNYTLDIELIPTIAKDIAEKLELNISDVHGILIAIVSSNLITAYNAAIESQVDNDIIESYKNKLESVLSLEERIEYAEVSQARKIINETYEFYRNENANEVDVTAYLDLLLTDIESTGIDRETAIDLKTLPIIKSISETLDKMETLDKDSEDYVLCRNMLRELTAAYENLVEKKEEKRTAPKRKVA